MVIDANVYWFLEELFEDAALRRRFAADAAAAGMHVTDATGADGTREIVVADAQGNPNLNYRSGDYTVAHQLAAMDEAGVDHAVLKVPGAHGWMSLDLCRMFNDGMAEHVRRGAGRFTALACVPPSDDPAVLAELRRCREDLGLAGLQLSTHYGSDYLDSPRFTRFFDAVAEEPTTVYVHHSPAPVDGASLADHTNLRRSYGRCVDQATAVGRELFGGLFERHPDLRVVHSMLGGAFHSVLDLLLPSGGGGHGRFADAARHRATLARHVYFETSHAQPWGPVQLPAAVRVLGADHVAYGSSFPVNAAWMSGGPAFVRALDLSTSEQDLVLAGTAADLYGVPTTPVHAAATQASEAVAQAPDGTAVGGPR